jgi:hypothetical protein
MAAAIALSAAGVAFGDAGNATDPDEKAVPKNFDIRGVAQGHMPNGDLAHLVSVQGRFPSAFPNTSDVPILTIDPEAPGGDVYTVQVYEDATADVTVGFEETGPAVVTLTRKNVLRFEFSPDAIGNPSSYSWRFNYYREGTDDRAPNRGMYEHRLR